MTLVLDALTVGYAKTRGAVVSDVSLSLEVGAFVCVLGRNGAGKSTLMRTIAGLQPSLTGCAQLDGAEIAALSAAERARRIAVVLTERASSPGLTVDDVVALGRQPFTDWRGQLRADDMASIQASLERADAARFRGRLFDDLSDGERQRVMIARAIAQAPKLMILDEITAFLDLPGRVEVMALLRRYARETACIVILSSHDLELSLQLADLVWLLGGDGRVQVGAPQALMKNGALGRAFDTEDVKFSAQLGRFELRRLGTEP